ncbi:unnamed protein product [Prunus armeniaca]
MQHISPLCPFCQSSPETTQHLFMDCQFAKDVWALSSDLMPFPSQIGDLYNWLLSLSATSTKSDLDPLSKALLISCVGLDFWRLNSTNRSGSIDSMIIKWHRPPTGWIKVNFDGSLMNSHASTSFIIRDCEGHVLVAGSNNIGENSINVVECIALCDGLAAALDRGWDQIVIEGDSKLVIDSILAKANPPWCIQQIIQDIWALSSSVASIRFQHIFREANFTADAVAKLGHGLSNQVLWEHRLPLSVRTPFYFDLFRCSCPRGFFL